MVAQYIQLGNRGWNVLVYYWVTEEDFEELTYSLRELDCPKADIKAAIAVLRNKNTGFTFSNFDYKMSVVCIGHTSDVTLFISTAIHEAKHVQSHICSYYKVDESSETAAYLIGYLVSRMYKMLAKLVKRYV